MTTLESEALAPDVFPARRRPDRVGDDWLPVLKTLPLFAGMSARHLRRIPARAKRFGPGETIVRAGDPGNAFYVVLDGEVRVDLPGGRFVALGAGDYFGEMARSTALRGRPHHGRRSRHGDGDRPHRVREAPPQRAADGGGAAADTGTTPARGPGAVLTGRRPRPSTVPSRRGFQTIERARSS